MKRNLDGLNTEITTEISKKRTPEDTTLSKRHLRQIKRLHTNANTTQTFLRVKSLFSLKKDTVLKKPIYFALKQSKQT